MVIDEGHYIAGKGAALRRRRALRRRLHDLLPAGLHAVRRPRPRLVRRPDLERLRRQDHHRRPGQGQRLRHRREGRRRPGHPARHGPLPGQGRASTWPRRSPTRTSWPCAKAQGAEIQKHDILIIRTGWIAKFYKVSREEFYGNFVEPGLTYSPELVQWFHDMEIPNLVTDTIANEVTVDPVSGVVLPLHNALMRNLGVTLTEIAWLDDLADDCAADGQYTFLYVAAPLKVVNGHRLAGEPGRHQVSVECQSRSYAGPALAGPRTSRGHADRHRRSSSTTPSRCSERGRARRATGAPASSTSTASSPWPRSTAPSDALAVGAGRPTASGRGDRLARLPAERPAVRASAMLATWKAGGIDGVDQPDEQGARARATCSTDSGASVLVCLESLYDDVGARASSPGTTAVAHGDHHQRARLSLGAACRRLLAGVEREPAPAGTLDLVELIDAHDGEQPRRRSRSTADDVAFLTYTSGTTGPPKGAMNTHRNVVFNSAGLPRTGCRSTPDDVVLGVAPLFHITGLIAAHHRRAARADAARARLPLRPRRRARPDRAAPARRSPSGRSPCSSP